MAKLGRRVMYIRYLYSIIRPMLVFPIPSYSNGAERTARENEGKNKSRRMKRIDNDRTKGELMDMDK